MVKVNGYWIAAVVCCFRLAFFFFFLLKFESQVFVRLWLGFDYPHLARSLYLSLSHVHGYLHTFNSNRDGEIYAEYNRTGQKQPCTRNTLLFFWLHCSTKARVLVIQKEHRHPLLGVQEWFCMAGWINNVNNLFTEWFKESERS